MKVFAQPRTDGGGGLKISILGGCPLWMAPNGPRQEVPPFPIRSHSHGRPITVAARLMIIPIGNRWLVQLQWLRVIPSCF